jgi:hypothetical protein
VIAADLLSVASEEKRRVVESSVVVRAIAADDQIKMVFGGGGAETLEHARDRLRQTFFDEGLVGGPLV